MFHHFHNDKHLQGQGSLSDKDFEAILDWLDEKYNLIGANDYLQRLEENALNRADICLSFDDALLCQYDIAFPILKKRKLDAFFFVYSSVFTGNPDSLEIFRYFRTNCFSSIDDFYELFFGVVEREYTEKFEVHKKGYGNLDYLAAFPFYSKNDKWFRYIRDQMLGSERYNKIMYELMSLHSFNPSESAKLLWMTEGILKELSGEGHLIGLHSYSHPTQMNKLSYEEQQNQFTKNLEHLESLLGKGTIVSMSHPCGNYNDETLKILTDLKIKIGFRSSLSRTDIRSNLEIPRDDHANVFKEMQK
jgi:peptidoglycan/xylan/chitin deacetylase (PgdA/CDA1 family)